MDRLEKVAATIAEENPKSDCMKFLASEFDGSNSPEIHPEVLKALGQTPEEACSHPVGYDLISVVQASLVREYKALPLSYDMPKRFAASNRLIRALNEVFEALGDVEDSV